ncbi:hypothetical protein M3M33_13715, partial [Loigolactobacillus coryniformis]|uniref:hypothetical protein n=1 Tax=Loigolactobacillus coryniformis TaxID=1610 RepID=UPI00201AD605
MTPGAEVVVLERISDVVRLRSHPGPVVALLSREGAKLGHGWRSGGQSGTVDGAEVAVCPRCGSVAEVRPDVLAEKRIRCEGGAR